MAEANTAGSNRPRSRTPVLIGGALALAALAGGAALLLGDTPVGGGAAWELDYFATEQFQGDPIRETADTIDFAWGNSAPVDGVLVDQFSLRARTCLKLAHPTPLVIDLMSDDGSRLLIGGRLAIDNWGSHGERTRSAELTLPPGLHEFALEYFDHSANAALRLDVAPAAGPAAAPLTFVPPSSAGPGCTPERNAAAPDAPRFRGEYFANRNLDGEPEVQTTPWIDFDWREAPPGPTLPADEYSARWDACLDLDASTPVTFFLASDDGSRLFLDGLEIVDNWGEHGVETREATAAIAPGRHHLRVEYFEATGGAGVSLRTRTASGFPLDRRWLSPPPDDDPSCGLEIIPPPSGKPAWRGQYYDNKDLDGQPIVVRGDAALDFRWGEAAPAEQIPAEEFSARWDTCLRIPEPTEVRFRLESDDGSRLAVDGRMVTDNWGEHGERVRQGEIKLRPGVRHIRVEFFDDSLNAMLRLHAQFPGAQWGALDGRWLSAPPEPYDPTAPCAALETAAARDGADPKDGAAAIDPAR